MNENGVLHKEIDLIQGVINRMASNSFYLKGWLISLVSAILVLSRDSVLVDNITSLAIVLCLPIVAFWYLDAFFLHKERCYRKLYEWVLSNRNSSDKFLYSLNYSRFKNDVNPIWRIMFSNTLLPFYGLSLIILVCIISYNIYC